MKLLTPNVTFVIIHVIPLSGMFEFYATPVEKSYVGVQVKKTIS